MRRGLIMAFSDGRPSLGCPESITTPAPTQGPRPARSRRLDTNTEDSAPRAVIVGPCALDLRERNGFGGDVKAARYRSLQHPADGLDEALARNAVDAATMSSMADDRRMALGSVMFGPLT